MHNSSYQLSRKRDIQIIRGMAVLAVVCFHLDLPYAEYGYLGVDAFFVISGYVMMPRIQQLTDGGRRAVATNLSSFYRRRVARLLPASGITIGLSVPLLMVLGLPGDFQRISKQAIASIFLAGNLGAYRYSGTSYFTPNPNPLVHTWSLSAEEQIYLLIPLLVTSTVLLRSKERTTSIILLCTAASYLSEIFLQHTLILSGKLESIENVIFYSPITRIWQFGIGSLFYAFSKRSYTLRLKFIFTITFLASIFFQSVLPQNTWICLLTGQIASHNLMSNLGNRLSIIEWFGDRSYSIYLVHMPIIYLIKTFWFSDVTQGTVENFQRIFLSFFIVVIIAIALYNLVEKKYRSTLQLLSMKQIIFRTSFFPIVSTVTCTVIFGQLLPGYGHNTDLLGKREISQAESRGCVNTGLTPRQCTWNSDGIGDIFLVGDSQAWSYSDGVIEAAKKSNNRVIVSSMDHCPFIGTRLSFLLDSEKSTCSNWQADTLKYILKSKPSLLILANRGDGWIKPGFANFVDSQGNAILDSNSLFGEYERVLKNLTNTLKINNIPVLIISESAWTPNVYDSSLLKRLNNNLSLGFDREAAVRGGIRTLRLYKKIASEKKAWVYEPNQVLCPTSRCSYFLQNKRLYWNHDHISVSASLLLVQSIAESISKIGAGQPRSSDKFK